MANGERLIAVVLAVAFDNEDKVLLTRRNDPVNASVHGYWQFPGGVMEFGEHPEQTLRREVEEELQVGEIRLLRNQPIVRSTTFTRQDSEREQIADQLLVLAYVVSLPKEVNIDNDPETLAYAWFAYSELEPLKTLPLVKGIAEEAKAIWDELKRQNRIG